MAETHKKTKKSKNAEETNGREFGNLLRYWVRHRDHRVGKRLRRCCFTLTSDASVTALFLLLDEITDEDNLCDINHIT